MPVKLLQMHLPCRNRCCSRVLCITDPIRLNLPNNETEKSFAAHIVPLHTDIWTPIYHWTHSSGVSERIADNKTNKVIRLLVTK